MAKPGTPSSGEYVELPEGEWLTCQITEHEVYEDTYEGKASTRVVVDFAVLDEEYEGGHFKYWAGFTLHEKGKLAPLAKAVSGLEGEALFEGFDTDMLDGAKVRVLGQNVTKPGSDGQARTFFKPTMFKAATKAAKPAAAAAAKPKAKPVEDDDDDIDI